MQENIGKQAENAMNIAQTVQKQATDIVKKMAEQLPNASQAAENMDISQWPNEEMFKPHISSDSIKHQTKANTLSDPSSIETNLGDISNVTTKSNSVLNPQKTQLDKTGHISEPSQKFQNVESVPPTFIQPRRPPVHQKPPKPVRTTESASMSQSVSLILQN